MRYEWHKIEWLSIPRHSIAIQDYLQDIINYIVSHKTDTIADEGNFQNSENLLMARHISNIMHIKYHYILLEFVTIVNFNGL